MIRGYKLDGPGCHSGYGNVKTHLDAINEFRFVELGNIPDKAKEPWFIIYHEGGRIKHSVSEKKIEVLDYGEVDP